MSEAQEPLLGKEATPSQSPPPRPKRLRWPQFLTAAVIGILASTLLHTAQYRLHHRVNVSQEVRQCPNPDAIPIKAPRTNVWKNLDINEAVELRQWLMQPERGLNLTRADEAWGSDNWIHFVEGSKPRKDEALAYLEDPTKTFPRYAHAVILHGPKENIVDYSIGPLPISNHTTITPISYHNPIPLNAAATFNWTIIGQAVQRAFAPLDPITRDLFNGSVLDGTLMGAGAAPMSYDGEWRRSWLQLRFAVPGPWLQAVDFYVYTDFTGTDPSRYHLKSIVHNRTIYHSTEDAVAAWKRGEMVRQLPYDSDWATRSIKGKPRDLDDRPGPRTVQLDGARYKVDSEEGYVSWMGWQFYMSFERDMGLHLWDINFRDERIIYELSPQEAMAQYSGDDPHQGSCVWLDRAFGMGANVREVILGYDCPSDATLLNATVHESGSSVRRNAICVFERESGRPISRHTGFGQNEMGAIKGYEMVVRTVSTVGNYDYIFDYTFQLDGTIEIRLSASGYLQGGVWKDEQAPYGHMIHPGFMGSLHDHVINYKIDFDIAGTQNSFMAVSLEMEDKDEPWLDDDWGSVARQQRLSRKILPEESLLEWSKNAEGTYVVQNQNQLNAWGNPRGYAIHPGPLCHLTNLDSKRTENNVNWAKHHLAVSRRKEDEQSSSSTWNINLPGAPPVNFYKFFDNETIEQEDLVVWANLGMHHIPRAEDSPNTLTNLATSYILLSPFNYNDYDVSMESLNSVILNRNENGDFEVKEAIRTKEEGVCMPRPQKELTYHGVDGYREDGSRMDRVERIYEESMVEMGHGLRGWRERGAGL